MNCPKCVLLVILITSFSFSSPKLNECIDSLKIRKNLNIGSSIILLTLGTVGTTFTIISLNEILGPSTICSDNSDYGRENCVEPGPGPAVLLAPFIGLVLGGTSLLCLILGIKNIIYAKKYKDRYLEILPKISRENFEVNFQIFL